MITDYRAWSCKWKKMIYHGKDGYTIDVLSNTAWIDSCDDELILLMQYSNYNDKNKNKIYVGDILEVINEGGLKIRVVCEFGIARRIIKGDKLRECDIACFYFKLENGMKSFPIVKNYLGKSDLDIMEIVGNIHHK